MEINYGIDEKRTFAKLLVPVTEYLQKVQCDTNNGTLPFKCAVSSCPNIFLNYEDHQSASYKFHNFPTDVNMCKMWKRKCSLPETIDINFVKICSGHFSFDDYICNYKEEFNNERVTYVLKAAAAPNLNLDGPTVPILLSQLINPNFTEIKTAVDENNSLKTQFECLDRKQEKLSKKLQLYEKKLMNRHKDLAKMKKLLKDLQSKNKTIKHDRNLIHKVFSDSQINLLLGKKKVIWSDDDLAMAFTLRHMGNKECYLYLKNVLNMPLPSLTCVQKWVSSLK